ncbi:MAG: bifunctional riboflavin kinase/FAD synthetase [Nocardioidaceae bacterium]
MVQVWRSLAGLPDLGRTVVTVGNFDGVHLGHQQVLRRACEVAGELGLEHVVAVTFDPHPFAVLRPEHAPPLLTTIETRTELLGAAGADGVLVVPFDREVASWSPERFVAEVIVGALHAKAVVVGANFRFGHKAAGDVSLLHRLGESDDFVAEGVALDGGPQVWSSTYVRNCLIAGDVEGAAEALGRPYAIQGVVIRGDQRGRELGFPTANVPISGLCAPADGVYAGWVYHAGERLPAAISIGTNPTFAGERDRRVESYVLDRTDLDLYDQRIEVEFTHRIRGMVAFESVAKLVEVIESDVAETRRLLGL